MKKMNFSSRLLAVYLTAAMLLSSFSACGKGEEKGGDTTASGSDTTLNEAVTIAVPDPGTPVAMEGEPIVLTSDFVLVCSDNQSDSMLMLANSLKTKIRAKTGLTLSMGHIGSHKENEIVLGYLEDRAACAPAYAALAHGDYNVYTSENTLVLGAWTNENLSAAVDLLIEKALVQDGDRWLIYPYAVSFGNTVTTELDLSQYRIVYATDASDYVKKDVVPALQEALRKDFGATLEAVTDAETPVEQEIVVGVTNRTSAKVDAYLHEGEKQLSYYGHAIVADGARIYLTARTDFALYRAVDSLCELATPEVGPAVFCLSADEWAASSADADTTDTAELAEGADIRVMSYNILHQNWSNVTSLVPVEGRDERVANILLYYMPDVVGLQEVSALWHQSLNELLVETGLYEKACEKNNANAYNMTTFLYNPRTVKLVDSYVIDLDKNSEIRVFSVAIFEKLSDGTRFVVTNTHPAPTGQAENYARNFADLITLVGTELVKYQDLSLIMTGDFNTKEQSSMYTSFMKAANVKDAKYEAKVLVRDYCTFSGWEAAPKAGNANCIDHIFVNADTHVKLFNVVIDFDVHNTSDHIPIYADIDLK